MPDDLQHTQLPPATAPFDAKELDSLHEAERDLSGRISSVSLIRLTVMIILVMLFASGIRKQSAADVQGILGKIKELQDNYETGSIDPIGVYLADSGVPLKNSQVAPKSSATRDDNTQAQEMAELKGLLGSLRQRYRDTFLVKVSVLGTDLSFDLRTVILTLPFWLPLIQIYTDILKGKRRIFRAVAAARLTEASHGEVAVMDRLVFDSPGAVFNRFPDTLVGRLYILFVLVLGVMTILILNPSNISEFVIRLIGCLLFTTIFYARSYSTFVCERMRQEMGSLFSVEIPPEWPITLQQSALARWSTIRRRLPPRPALIASGTLILLTLGISTAEVGCHSVIRNSEPWNRKPCKDSISFSVDANGYPLLDDDDRLPFCETTPLTYGEPRPGYQIFTREAEWPQSRIAVDLLIDKGTGECFYAVILVAGLIGIAIGASPWLESRLPTLVLGVLRFIALLISLIVICFFAGPAMLIFSTWLLPFAVGLVMLALMCSSRSKPQRRISLFNGLTSLVIPIVVADLVSLVELAKEYGLTVLYIGVHLLTLGFIVLLDRRLAQSVPTTPIDASSLNVPPSVEPVPPTTPTPRLLR